MTESINHSQQLDQCLITGQPVVKVLDFGQHAYADTFVAQDQLNLSEPVFPLQVNLNPDSGHLQLAYISHAEERYNLYSYSYTSSNSKVAKAHWEEYAAEIKRKYNPTGVVVEIGCNDGYLINQFKDTKINAIGVDSSDTMCRITESLGVTCIQTLFDANAADMIRNMYGPAQVVMANNVFNHANDPVAFASAVAQILDEDGVFVFEVPYWFNMVESGRFVDMVYHEHISYFTIKSAWNLLKAAGLEIVDFSIVDYHGGSMRVSARRDRGGDMPKVVEVAIIKEKVAGLFTVELYQELQAKFVRQRDAWLADFYQLRYSDPTAVFIGVGAAAKANTWLTWHGLTKTHLHCITDASQYKQGKYTPLSRIPILSDDEFAQHANPYALILSWNISEGLKQALLKINPNTRFINQ
jgi:SAM-dependent methyltransferase